MASILDLFKRKPAPAVKESTIVVTESTLTGIDKDDWQYRRLSSGYYPSRHVSSEYVKKSIEFSRYMYDMNPLAHGIIETVKDFVVGEGFTPKVQPRDKKTKLELEPDAAEAVVKKAQAIIDAHWEDPRNNWELKQHQRVRELCMDGEQIYPAFVNVADGSVHLGLIDPLQVKEVYYNPENMEEPVAVETYGKNPNDSRFYRVIHADDDPLSPSFERLIGAQEGETFKKTSSVGRSKTYPYVGSCFYFPINKHSSHARGRPDLMAITDWLEAYDRIMYQHADRMDIMASFIWDVTLNNADERKIEEWIAKHQKPPKPGSIRVHNEAELWQALAPDMRWEDNQFGASMIKAQILSKTGLPPFWFAEGGETTRATALEMGTPAIKRLGARQLEIIYAIKTILTFVIDQAIIYGELDGSIDYKVYIEAPEMSSRDLTRAGSAMLSVLGALEGAIANHVCSREAAQEIFINISQQLGVNLDIDAMRRQIESQPDPQDDPLHPSYVNKELIKMGMDAKAAQAQGSGGFRNAPGKQPPKSDNDDADQSKNKNAS